MNRASIPGFRQAGITNRRPTPAEGKVRFSKFDLDCGEN